MERKLIYGIEFHVNFSFTFLLLPSGTFDYKRLPNGSINFSAFNELAAIVSAFTFHMGNVSTTASKHTDEFNHLVNHIFTCQLKDENGKRLTFDLLPNNDFYFPIQSYLPPLKRKQLRLKAITMFPEVISKVHSV